MGGLERDESMAACVISSIFGKTFKNVYSAPEGYISYFFTNIKKLENEITEKGWKYLYVDFTVSDDEAISSFQSKYVKFLQFRKDNTYPSLEEYQQVVYVDHKFFLEMSHITRLLNIKKSPLLIRKTPRLKETVWDEVNAALGQERYRRFMPQTLDYIRDKIENGYSENVRICNTGLIVYDLKNVVINTLVNEVYADLVSIGTSECQIVWALVSQRYREIIQTIEWDEIPMVWEAPNS